MMRVVIDTNVFVSAIFWEGNYCSRIVDAWRSGDLILVSSLEIIEELVKTLKNFKIDLPDDIIESWRSYIIETAVLVEPSEKLFIVKKDLDDNKFFEAALVGRANYLISQDKKHILSIPEYQGIKTIHPEVFVLTFL